MTDRIHSITLVLEHDMRDDDVEPLMKALGQFRHVVSATANVADVDSHMAEVRAEALWHTKILNLLHPPVMPEIASSVRSGR